MVDPGTILQIRRLLAEGKLSQRAIARQLGVSRLTIAGVASGKRPDYIARRAERERAGEEFEPAGPPMRCPGCGGMVLLPCLLCRVRASKARDRQRARTTPLPVREGQGRVEAFSLRAG